MSEAQEVVKESQPEPEPEGAPPGPPSEHWPEEPLDPKDERLLARRPRIGEDRMVWVTTADRRAALQAAADDIYQVVRDFFDQEAARIARALGKQPPIPSDADIEAAVRRALDEYDWGRWQRILRPQLEDTFRRAAYSGVASSWAALANANISLTWDTISPWAVHYARQRAAELVGMHVMPDGSVVPAQDAKLRIDQDTRFWLHHSIVQWIEEGRSWSSIAHALESFNGQNGTWMSDWRARRIARTEASFAFNRGSIAAFRQAGFERVRVVDGTQDALCAEANGQVWTLEEAEQRPLQHPHCSRHFVAIVPDAPALTSPVGRLTDEPPESFAATAEAEAWAKARWPAVQWDFAGADPRAARAVVAQMHRLMREFPDVAKRITYVGTYTGSGRWRKWHEWGENTWAHSTNDGVIAINPRWANNADEWIRSIRAAPENRRIAGLPFHAPGPNKGIESVITHEFAHQIQFWIESEGSDLAFVPLVRGSGFGLIRDTFHTLNEDLYAGRPLTGYGALNDGSSDPRWEAWADTVEALYWGSPEYRRKPQVQSAKALLELLRGPKWDKGNWRWVSDVSRDEIRRTWDMFEKLFKRLHWRWG